MIDIDTSWEWIAMYGPVQYNTVQYSIQAGADLYGPAPSLAYGMRL